MKLELSYPRNVEEKSPANKGRLYVYKVVDGKKKVKYIVSEDGPRF